MQYRRLGRTDLSVSLICLGTMTWGRQNTEAEGHAQMDYALDRGVTFFDTAEMYAVPPTEATYGRTEEIIGTWFAARGTRDKVVLATKVIGPSANFPYVRGGQARLDAENITAACDASLKRLQTDYIDLYQTHWPNRQNNRFSQLNYHHNPDEDFLPPEETLRALQDLVTAGKVRHIGLSNETPWGVMAHLALAETLGLPRVQSIQNPYSLLNRTFEIGLAEIALREHVGLLAYAPLGAGTLTGKYLGGVVPPGTRRSIDGRGSRYDNLQTELATLHYVRLARDHGLDPAHMALAYVNSRPFMTANIIGATSMEQLKTNIDSIDVTLSEEVLDGIEAIAVQHPNPAP